MGKIVKQSDKADQDVEVELTFEQVKELANEVEALGSVQQFLINKKVIKVDEKGSWSVMKYDGLKGTEAIYGYYYKNDIPYTFWSEVMTQVNYFIRRREEKRKAQSEAVAPVVEPNVIKD